MKRIFATLLLLTILGGCAPVDKVLNLVHTDAQSTMSWVEREEAAGRLSPQEAAMARECPSRVIELHEIKKHLAEGMKTDDDNFRGIIYFSTVSRYSGHTKEAARIRAQQMIIACVGIIPVERFGLVF